MTSVNRRAFEVVREMIAKADELNIKVIVAPCRATVIDCGVDVEGSINAGLYLARITAGDLIRFSLTNVNYGDFILPALNAYSDYPVMATMGAQLRLGGQIWGLFCHRLWPGEGISLGWGNPEGDRCEAAKAL